MGPISTQVAPPALLRTAARGGNGFQPSRVPGPHPAPGPPVDTDGGSASPEDPRPAGRTLSGAQGGTSGGRRGGPPGRSPGVEGSRLGEATRNDVG